jgi:hypothetical protein
MQKSNGFIFIKERNITLLSFDGIAYFFKEIEPSVVIIFPVSIFLKISQLSMALLKFSIFVSFCLITPSQVI